MTKYLQFIIVDCGTDHEQRLHVLVLLREYVPQEPHDPSSEVSRREQVVAVVVHAERLADLNQTVGEGSVNELLNYKYIKTVRLFRTLKIQMI